MSKEMTIDETIENAVINHDRLVKENKRLRNILKRLASHDSTRHAVTHFFLSEASEPDLLLSELHGKK